MLHAAAAAAAAAAVTEVQGHAAALIAACTKAQELLLQCVEHV